MTSILFAPERGVRYAPDVVTVIPPELHALRDAFSRGNYAHVHVCARAILNSPALAEHHAEARATIDRTRAPVSAVLLLVVTAVLVLAVGAWWIVHATRGHGS